MDSPIEKVISVFRRAGRRACNHRTRPKLAYPVTNEILACFPETIEQNPSYMRPEHA